MSDAPLLDEEHARFILLPGISMTASSRGAGNRPELGRVHGVRVAADRRRVTVLLPGEQYPDLIDALRASRAIAVVFSQPSTHRTIQLKGADAEAGAPAAADRELARRCTEGFAAELAALRYDESVVRAALWFDPQALVAVGFTPCAAFQQTPGPRAGAPLAA
ncbi:MAG: hypothetical protein AB7K53_00320 [Burkholderiales bacterium]